MAGREDGSASLVVVDPNGRRSKVALHPFPFRIGRAPDNHLVLRDSRVSRNHAQIASRDGQCVLEDLSSRHGVWLNGERVERPTVLRGSDRIEFGVPDGYQIHFTDSVSPIQTYVAKPIVTGETGKTGSANLEKLRAVLEVARSLQSSYSADDVLNAVVDATLAVTGAERGFLLLFDDRHALQVRSARARGGKDLPPDELRVPRKLIQRALESRRDLFTMSFDPNEMDDASVGNTIAALELRSVACVPLVRVNLSANARTQVATAGRSSVGVLYMDSRLTAVDLAGGNRELLQTLAIEASTVLENARLLEEERAKQHIEEELAVARRIQQSLLPPNLPRTGWLRVCGSSMASHEVGGDYFDVMATSPEDWSLVIADVAGKGVSSALLASFLQGAFLSLLGGKDIADALSRINDFLTERAEHGKYATVFFASIHKSGELIYANAGHCAPLLVKSPGTIESLATTSMPIGLVPSTAFALERRQLHPGDRLVLYTDGVTEAQDAEGDFFGRARLREAVRSGGEVDCAGLHDAVQRALREFTGGAEQSDDITLVVAEFSGAN
jgi:serine phosphatase RsbU (regulator of sigma subunit)